MSEPRARLLVVGYGSTLRSDDAVGSVVSARIESMHLPGVETITCELLTPELADPLSRADAVVFVDASVDVPVKNGVLLRDLEPAESSQILAHAADPRTLLALARDVFGHAPRAWWLTIPAVHLGIGEEMSSVARKGVEEAVRKVQALARPQATGEDK